MGRTAVGVWGIRPKPGDYLVAMVVVHPEATLLVAGANGLGKRTSFDEYREQSRGGAGIITMKTGDRTGGVVGALTVLESDELMLTTNKGKTVRTRVSEIREAGRNTMGVKLIELGRNEKLQDIARVINQGDDEETPGAAPAGDSAPDTEASEPSGEEDAGDEEDASDESGGEEDA
jgi:DNA gyrase subunit A